MNKILVLLLVILLLMATMIATVCLVLTNTEFSIDEIFDFSFENDDSSDNDDEIVFEKAEKYSEFIEEYAVKYDVPVALLYAVIECESGFRENAKSSVGACGLMQLMPETYSDIRQWKGFDYTDDQITEPQVNIECGTYYLSRLYKMFGDWELVIAAYNAGPGNVQSWLKNDEYSDDGKLVYIPFSETSAHVEKVVKAWNKYEKHLKG